MHQAKEWFAGTKYQEANVARAKALDDKWNAEVARLEKERLETLKAMTAAATAAWPGIAAGVGGGSSLNPREGEPGEGEVLRSRGDYNRRGGGRDGHHEVGAEVEGGAAGRGVARHRV